MSERANKDKTVSAHVLLSEAGSRDSAPPISAIVCWGVVAPGNLGAILRLAANFGCPRVLVVEPAGTKHNMRLVRKTAVDAPSFVEWTSVTPEEFTSAWATKWPIVGVETSERSFDLRDAQWPAPCAVMVGGESWGLPDEAVALCATVVHIPTRGPLHSLNVSHALAIALYGAAQVRPPRGSA